MNKVTDMIIRMKRAAGVEKDIELAAILGTNKNTFSGWKIQNQKIPIENTIEFCNKYNTTLDWIIRGKGRSSEQAAGICSVPFYNKLNMSDLAKSAKTFFDNNESIIISMPLPMEGCKPDDDIIAYRSIGIDMPYTSPKGSVVFINMSRADDKYLFGMYIIETKSGVSAKLITQTSDKDIFLLKSENKHIETWKLSRSEFTIVGRISAVMKYNPSILQ